MNRAWLAGFIEGEGCFGLYLHGKYYQPEFTINIRDDDATILKEIRETLQCKAKLSYRKPKGRSMPQVQLMVRGINDLLKLIAFLDENPFIGKKQPQYKLWKEAVQFCKTNMFTTQGHPEKLRQKSEQLKSYADRLKELKTYNNSKQHEPPS